MTPSPTRFVDLDSSATTPVSERVLAAMLPWFREVYANPGSPSKAGERAREAVAESRSHLAAFLGADPREIILTGGATESNQSAIRSALRARPERRTLLVSSVEHSSILGLASVLEGEGVKVVTIPAGRDGRIDPLEVARRVDSKTALVAVMWVNNETGALNPVAKIAEIAREAGALFLTDAVAAAGKVPIDLSQVQADFLSLSAHKFYGPKGIGALFVRKGTEFFPLLPGSQERRRRGGTENVPGIVGLGEAARESREFLVDGPGRLSALGTRLEEGLRSLDLQGVRNGPESDLFRAPHIVNMRFSRTPGEKVLIELGREGIGVSMGSACSAGSMEPSHVLLAMGLTREEAMRSVRFSLGREASSCDIDRTIEALGRILETNEQRRVS